MEKLFNVNVVMERTREFINNNDYFKKKILLNDT